MKNACIVVLSLTWCAAAIAQQGIPPNLLHATQCLAAKRFLPPLHSGTLNFGYATDTESYPGETVLYVVQYLKSNRSNGLVYTVFLTREGGEQVFNIQNNASFEWPTRPDGEIDFVNPPLGGDWTQTRLMSAIRRILAQPRITIPADVLRAVQTGIRCEAYTDLQR